MEFFFCRFVCIGRTAGASPYDSGYCSASGGPAHGARNDYDGDGKADLSLYNNSTNQYLWKGLLSACQYAQVTSAMGKRGDVSVPADYDGDGVTEPAFYNSAAAAWLLLKPDQGILPYVFMLGGPGWEASAADYDGDAKADPVVYRAATAEWQVNLSGSGYAAINLAWGGPGWKMVSRDYDGDGRTDPAMYCEQSGLWSVLFSASGYTPVSFMFGGPGYAAIPADYDGDMKSDPAIYGESNPSTVSTNSTSSWQTSSPQAGSLLRQGFPLREAASAGQVGGQAGQASVWAFKISSADYLTIVLTQTLGGTGYIPVPSDYDGDGLADPCVFNASTGEWRVLFSGSAYALVDAVFGASGDSPTGP